MEENSVVEETPSEVATPVAETPVTETPAAVAPVETNEGSRGRRKERIGKVVSDKMDKTIIVTLTRQVPHPLYKKYFKKTTKFVAHNENNDAKLGDTVRIMETRPLSRTKRWRVVEVLQRAK